MFRAGGTLHCKKHLLPQVLFAWQGQKDLNRPSCGARKALRGRNPLVLFDRCASLASLLPPPVRYNTLRKFR